MDSLLDNIPYSSNSILGLGKYPEPMALWSDPVRYRFAVYTKSSGCSEERHEYLRRVYGRPFRITNMAKFIVIDCYVWTVGESPLNKRRAKCRCILGYYWI